MKSLHWTTDRTIGGGYATSFGWRIHRPSELIFELRSRLSRGILGIMHAMAHRLRPALVVLLCMASLMVASCGDDPASSDTKTKQGPVAEPAKAPKVMSTPAGTIKNVAPLPQGLAYDAKTNRLAVAVHDPYRLLVLDGKSLKILKSVKLPGKARHLQMSGPGGPVLVPVETSNELFEVPLTGDDAPVVVDVGKHPHSAGGAPDGDVVVGNEFSGTLTFIRNGKVVGTNDQIQQPGSVLITGNTVVTADVRAHTVSTFDLKSMKRTNVASAGEGPTHAELLPGRRVAIIDTSGDQILIYDIKTLRQVGKLSLPGSPYGRDSDFSSDTLWITLTAKNQVVGIDTSSNQPKVIARYPTPRQPDTVAVATDAKTLWVTGTADGVIQRITR